MTSDTVIFMPDFFACIYLLCNFRRSAVNLSHRINGKDYKDDKAEKASEYKQVFSGICTHLMRPPFSIKLSLKDVRYLYFYSIVLLLGMIEIIYFHIFLKNHFVTFFKGISYCLKIS